MGDKCEGLEYYLSQINDHMSVLWLTLALLKKKGSAQVELKTIEKLYAHCEQVVHLNHEFHKDILEKMRR